MADEPKKPDEKPAADAPTPDTSGQPPANPPAGEASATPPPSEGSPQMPADPLSDGTVPTVLQKGSTTKPELPKGDKRSLGSVYRRADIVTTLITFGVTVLVAGLVFGGYLYFTRPKTKTAAPKVTTLDQTDLSKLGAFFEGDSAGSGAQVLTFNSPALFKGRVALNSDLKVSGSLEVDGPSQLSDLTVNKTSTLGVTNVRGQLTVSGPLSLQSPATLSAGATITGNLAVSGNGSFGGSLSAGIINTPSLTVNGSLNLNGHIILNGSTPSISPVAGAGSGASATINGTDTAGTLTITTGTIVSSNGTTGDQLAQVTFRTAYPSSPVVMLSPVGQSAGTLQYYITKSGTDFVIGSAANTNGGAPPLISHTSYSFDYWVVQ